MVEKSIIKIIKIFIKAIEKEKIRAEKVILYGSCASGRQREDSDIDLAIVSKDFGQDTVEEGMRLFRIAGTIDPRIEPVPISPESYKNDTWIPLIYEIRKNGVEMKV